MNYYLFLLAVFVLLVLLPLDFLTTMPLLRSLGLTFWELCAVFMLGFFYIVSLFSAQASFNVIPLYFSAAITVVLLFASIFGIQAINISALVRILLVIWFLPLFDSLCAVYGGVRIALLGFFILAIHAQWGMGHFIVQHDFALSPLGEVSFSASSSGVAKFRMWHGEKDSSTSEKIVRAYGPYTHANDYGGSIAIGLVFLLLFCVLYPWKVLDVHYLFSLISFIITSAYVLILGSLFSFSRAVYISLLSTGLVSLLLLTAWRSRFVCVFPWRRFFIGLFSTLIILSPFFIARLSDADDAGIAERVSAYRRGIHLFGWRGAGPGNYPDALEHYLNIHAIPYAPWQSTYVHSVPLLLLVEWGYICTALLLGFIIWFFKMYWPLPWHILPIVPLLLFDHYLATQVAPMVWVVLLVAVGSWFWRQKLQSVP